MVETGYSIALPYEVASVIVDQPLSIIIEQFNKYPLAEEGTHDRN